MKGMRLCEADDGFSETQGIQKKIFLMNVLHIKMSSGNAIRIVTILVIIKLIITNAYLWCTQNNSVFELIILCALSHLSLTSHPPCALCNIIIPILLGRGLKNKLTQVCPINGANLVSVERQKMTGHSSNLFLLLLGHTGKLHFPASPAAGCGHVTKFQLMGSYVQKPSRTELYNHP